MRCATACMRSGCPPTWRSALACRSSGWWLSRSAPGAAGAHRGFRSLRQQVEAALCRLPDDAKRLALALVFGGRVAVHVRGRAHLERVPQRAGLIDPLQPWHPVVRRRDQDHHVLRPALALWRRTALVREPRAAEQRRFYRPAVAQPGEVAAQLAVIQRGPELHAPILAA